MFELIHTLFERGGPVMFPILGVSVIAWCIIFLRLFELSNQKRLIREALIRVSSNSSQIPTANDTKKISFIEWMHYAKKRALSDKQLEEALYDSLELQRKELSTFLPTLAILAAIAPLLGLLGTVTGMIATFNTISLHGTGDPLLLGRGISEALITTEAGLIIAIPILLMHIYLVSKVDSIIAEIGQKASTLLTSIRTAK